MSMRWLKRWYKKVTFHYTLNSITDVHNATQVGNTDGINSNIAASIKSGERHYSY
jgi:hypothetical protein